MVTLLHIDSSIFTGEDSASRSATKAFRDAWQEQHPGGEVVYRDLSRTPVPHIDAAAHTAGFLPSQDHSTDQAAAFAARAALIEELEQADAVLIGAPMYNYSIPSTLKAWLDNVILFGRTAGAAPSAKGTPTVVVASRGGSYAPGTPKEPYEYVQNYLEAVLADMLELDVHFIVPELTMAPDNPAMAELVPLYEESRDRALAEAVAKAKEFAGRAAA
ncbi:FMN-dependent NADH-azoreductase [Streptomyces justiciae]|uniref:FMN dependent NADH:quinone oxidoreductase n=1 Tax=Streptomyces justiciae TaxID=2780140 RepID=A0ABU3M811_9ACTN|nr:NAD(P)H-dependent oxidoreductase [Streptomyces justiciae]MDT7847493.1 NAD(P)H-dependent oxidoreductase [Streptomyces justiciae]